MFYCNWIDFFLGTDIKMKLEIHINVRFGIGITFLTQNFTFQPCGCNASWFVTKSYEV